jgi:hypothetical protein
MGLNSQGLAVNDRRETWLFTEVEGRGTNRVYRRLKFNIVKYGVDPEEFLEPVNQSDFDDIIGMSGPIVSTSGGLGRFHEIKILPRGRLCDVHSFDDFDAAASSYTDIPGRTPTGWA